MLQHLVARRIHRALAFVSFRIQPYSEYSMSSLKSPPIGIDIMDSQNVALKILVVEDNDELRAATIIFFQNNGHYVRGVSMAEDIDDMAAGFLPDVYVIDLNLPDEDGLSLTRRLRATHPDVGIIITTARTMIGDRLQGYESGADHYFCKPVHPQELLACAHALGKRMHLKSHQISVPMSLNLTNMIVTGPAGDEKLTSGDVLILSAFIRAPGQNLERWQIAEIIGSNHSDSLPSTSSMEMRITRLRKKLISAGAPAPGIRAIHKTGYALVCRVQMVS